MAAIGSFGGNITSTAVGPKTASFIENFVLTAADTEYSYAFPASTKNITIRCRGDAVIKYTWTATESGTKYMTLFPGEVREFEDLNATITLYAQSPSATQTLEIEYWI